MSTVGYATMPVIPSLRGMEGEINKQLGGLTGMATKAGADSGRGFIGRFGSSLTSGLDSVGGTITKWAGRGFTAAGVAAGAVMAAGLWGGMKRALDREDAIVTFRRMGLDDRNIKQLTDSIDKALSGTPIANPEGFALAGRFLAQGFDTADIPSIVATLADMSTVGNRSFQEMSDVMVAAAGAGRLTAAELNRLGDVPLGKVAEQLGTTESGLRKMVSEGELTAEAFIAAFAAVEEFNGAAKDATTRVAFTNLKTAVAALGEQFLGPLLGEGGVAQRSLLSLREIVSSAGPVVAGLGQSFSNWLIPAIGRAADFFTGTLVPAIKSAVDWFAENRESVIRIASAVGPAVVAVGALATSVHLVTQALRILGMSTPVGLLMTLAAGLVYAWQNSEKFRTVVTGAFEAVRGAVERVTAMFSGGGGLSGAFETVRSLGETFVGWLRGVLGGAIEWLGTVWETIGPRVAAIGESFSGIAATLAPVAAWIGERLPGAFQAMWSVAGPIVRFLVTLIGDTLRMAIDGVVQVFQGAVGAIEGILNVFAGLFTGDWSRLWEGVKQIGVSIWNAIVGLVKTWLAVSVFKVIGTAMTAIRTVFTSGWAAIRGLFTNAGSSIMSTVRGWTTSMRTTVGNVMTAVRTAISNAWSTIRTIFSGGITFIRQVVQAGFALVRTLISNAMTAVRTTVANTMTGLRTSVSTGISNVLRYFRELPGRIRSAIPNPLEILRNVGRNIIEGLIGGITSAFDRVKSTLSGLTDMLPSWKGPLTVDRKLLIPQGEAIIQSLVRGFENEFGSAQGALASFTANMAEQARLEAQSALAGLVPAGGTMRVAGGLTPATASPANGPAVFNLYDADGELIGRMRGEAAQVAAAEGRVAVQRARSY